MKRGLITWNTDEIPRDEFSARQRQVQALLRSMDLPALVVYSDLWRSNHARFLTNFMPYFNRALLVMPADGPLVLLCGLSPRVYPWIRSVTTIEDIRPAGNFAAPLYDLAAERGWARVGIVDPGEVPRDITLALGSGDLVLVPVPGNTLYQPAYNSVEVHLRRIAARLCRSVLLEELPKATGLTD